MRIDTRIGILGLLFTIGCFFVGIRQCQLAEEQIIKSIEGEKNISECFNLVDEVKKFREYKKTKIEEMFLKYGDTSRIIEELRVPIPAKGLETSSCEEIKTELAKAKEYVCKSLRDYGEECD